MILVIDTNIVFSALLNPKSNIGELLIDTGNQFEFYAPEMLLFELDKYQDKIEKYTKLAKENIKIIRNTILDSINFISEDLISEKSWMQAFELTRLVDEKDTPFVALAIELNTRLWSGDRKLQDLNKKKKGLIINTSEVSKLSQKK